MKLTNPASPEAAAAAASDLPAESEAEAVPEPGYTEHLLNWHHRIIFIRWCADYPFDRIPDIEATGHPMGHLIIQSRYRKPLPVSSTGYHSYFLDPEDVCDDPVEFVRYLLDNPPRIPTPETDAVLAAAQQECS